MPSPVPFTLHHLQGKQYLKRALENALTLKANSLLKGKTGAERGNELKIKYNECLSKKGKMVIMVS